MEERHILRGVCVDTSKALSRAVEIVERRKPDPIQTAARRIAWRVARVRLDEHIGMLIARLNRQSRRRRLIEEIVRRRMNRAETRFDVEPADISGASADRQPTRRVSGCGADDV